MVSRRTALRLAGVALLPAAGCADRTAGPDGSTDSPTPTERSASPDSRPDSPTDRTPPEDLPDWQPAWTRTVEERHVLGLDTHDGTVYASLSNEGGPSAVAALDPADGTELWRTPTPGELEGQAYAEPNDGDDQWGVTVTDDRVFAVTGHADRNEWTALRALDRATGEVTWPLRRERKLAVRGVRDGTAYVTSLEFFAPEHSHDTPEEPLTSDLLAVDVADGTVRWSRQFAGVGDVAVSPAGVFVAAGTRLVGLTPEGDERFAVDTGIAGTAVEATADRVFFLGEGDGSLRPLRGYALDGTRDWGDRRRIRDVLLDRERERLYAAGDVTMALKEDGSVAWRRDVHGGHPLLLDGAREALYTRGGGSTAEAFSLPDGTHRWSVDPGERYAWPVAATTGTAVVEGFAEGRALYAVDAGSGEATRRRSFGDDAILFTVERAGDVALVGTGDASVVALPLEAVWTSN
ncbi:PQQ-binding-like beta-propeller repeat protein [Halobaculum sp. WSA2]|uniref:PQQ-binding-like beta-propeller repeat protein n=1 Tax=Halobaculum saliterrae TaxID=2073113 RepID=A0A6B0SUZ1_9EURY|nr:PQQ-binding-like beta-propeller repeat protein [Halobaculum saliterrae]MXR40022.1 PQQ-binding-like beta-propeller repeat protein [Halobaculum saliterrae]